MAVALAVVDGPRPLLELLVIPTYPGGPDEYLIRAWPIRDGAGYDRKITFEPEQARLWWTEATGGGELPESFVELRKE